MAPAQAFPQWAAKAGSAVPSGRNGLLKSRAQAALAYIRKVDGRTARRRHPVYAVLVSTILARYFDDLRDL
jgi:hypothetical protein